MNSQVNIIFVDVDDTLIRTVGSKRIPICETIRHIRRLHESGMILYLWSSGGAEYAEIIARELELSQCFVAFLPKPKAYIDDQPINEWRYCRHILPHNCDQLP